MKSCGRCKTEKSIEEYAPSKIAVSKSWCKDCMKTYRAQYYQDNKVKILEQTDQYKIDNPVKNLYYVVKARAKRKAIPFTITQADIIIPEKCPVLGHVLVFGKGNKNNPHLATLDKIIPRCGYVPGNVRVISARANAMKQDATIEELKSFGKWTETL